MMGNQFWIIFFIADLEFCDIHVDFRDFGMMTKCWGVTYRWNRNDLYNSFFSVRRDTNHFWDTNQGGTCDASTQTTYSYYADGDYPWVLKLWKMNSACPKESNGISHFNNRSSSRNLENQWLKDDSCFIKLRKMNSTGHCGSNGMSHLNIPSSSRIHENPRGYHKNPPQQWKILFRLDSSSFYKSLDRFIMLFGFIVFCLPYAQRGQMVTWYPRGNVECHVINENMTHHCSVSEISTDMTE